jgi:hypothetical protein
MRNTRAPLQCERPTIFNRFPGVIHEILEVLYARVSFCKKKSVLMSKGGVVSRQYMGGLCWEELKGSDLRPSWRGREVGALLLPEAVV